MIRLPEGHSPERYKPVLTSAMRFLYERVGLGLLILGHLTRASCEEL